MVHQHLLLKPPPAVPTAFPLERDASRLSPNGQFDFRSGLRNSGKGTRRIATGKYQRASIRAAAFVADVKVQGKPGDAIGSADLSRGTAATRAGAPPAMAVKRHWRTLECTNRISLGRTDTSDGCYRARLYRAIVALEGAVF